MVPKQLPYGCSGAARFDYVARKPLVDLIPILLRFAAPVVRGAVEYKVRATLAPQKAGEHVDGLAAAIQAFVTRPNLVHIHAQLCQLPGCLFDNSKVRRIAHASLKVVIRAFLAKAFARSSSFSHLERFQ